MRWLAVGFCWVSCVTGAGQVSPSSWVRQSPDSVEGAWISESTMAEHEGGQCRITITADHLQLRCSPGNRQADFRYLLSKRSSDAVILALTPLAGNGEDIQLEIESLRDERGTRALRIRDLQHPHAPPLGAYGRPELWVEETR